VQVKSLKVALDIFRSPPADPVNQEEKLTIETVVWMWDVEPSNPQTISVMVESGH